MVIYYNFTEFGFFELGRESKFEEINEKQLLEKYGISITKNGNDFIFNNDERVKKTDINFVYGLTINKNDDVLTELDSISFYEDRKVRDINTPIKEEQIILLKFLSNSSNRRILIKF